MTARIAAPWLADRTLQRLLKALNGDGEEARIVGGAIRNHMLGEPIVDIDIATTLLPRETMRRARAAGFRPIPTGIKYGTVTLVRHDRSFEVTTLRQDTETDGRRAKVIFGRDWAEDAKRRDFTINALYADAEGQIFDYVGGLQDMESRTLRFIGEAEERIQEDYLRLLRFFRFFAWYGGGRPDAAALKAAVKLKDGLKNLSAERVWSELKKLLSAPDPARALLWMRQAGVLTLVLPETERWGIDNIHGLIDAERAYGWAVDPFLRLMAIVPPDTARLDAMAHRLRASNAERKRLVAFTMVKLPAPDMAPAALRAFLLDADRQALADRLHLDIAVLRSKAAQGDDTLPALHRQTEVLKLAESFEPVAFPVSGDDVQAAGVPAGKAVGKALQRLRQIWLESGLEADRATLLAALQQGQQ